MTIKVFLRGGVWCEHGAYCYAKLPAGMRPAELSDLIIHGKPIIGKWTLLYSYLSACYQAYQITENFTSEIANELLQEPNQIFIK
jgi:hypothetical protein